MSEFISSCCTTCSVFL